MVNSSKKLQEDILDILKNSDQMLREFRRQIQDKYVIIFIGNTRNGKSTLVNYITGVPLISFQEGDMFRIKLESDASLSPTIGHGSLSHTTVPTVIPTRDRPDTVIVDAPGFDDNRGVLQEIINALYINQIKFSKGVRFVLVSDINNIINDNINNFLSFIETVHTIMPDFIKLSKAVSIIFTKDSREHSISEINDLLTRKILNVKDLNCEKELVEHFVKQNNLIGLFRMPTKTGELMNEINVNIDTAIFSSLPVDLSETDVKFGLSKRAHVALLETYLEFFDVVISLKEKFKLFRTEAMNGFCGLKKEKLLNFSNEQLNGEGGAYTIIEEFCEGIWSDELQIFITSDIPVSLRRIFINELNKVMLALEIIGVEVPNELDSISLDIIEEIENKLKYLDCIEVVVERVDKSQNIIRCYTESSKEFQNDLYELRKGIYREMQIREYLALEIRSLPSIDVCLREISELYLFASTRYELTNMRESLERSIALYNSIVGDIAKRPYLSHLLYKELQNVASIPNSISNKITDVNRHICHRDKEIFLENVSPSIKVAFGGMAIYTGMRFLFSGPYTQLTIAAGSFLLFALYSYKSAYMKTQFTRLQRRYRQKRSLMFRSRLQLDSYWKHFNLRRLHLEL